LGAGCYRLLQRDSQTDKHMKQVKLNTRIPSDLRKRLKVKAARDGVSIQKLVAEALERFLK